MILDTGPLYAALDRRDQDYQVCRRLIEEADERLTVPSPVLPELDHFVRTRLGAGPMLGFLQDVEDGVYDIEDISSTDYARIRELMDAYSDLDIGFVDAAVMTVAERFDQLKIATLDRRHFAVVRPRHGEAFEIVP